MVNEDNNSFMLTTIDNPYNPFTNFKEWYQFDTYKGYNTLGYQARMLSIDASMTDDQIEEGIQQVIDRILEIDPTNLYIKVTKESLIKPISLNSLEQN